MKKQFLILAATFITVGFISCSKKDMSKPASISEEQTIANKSGGPITIDPLSVGLEGWFTFDKHLKDVSKQLPDGQKLPVSRAGASFTTNRKGIWNSALKLDGDYWIRMANVPQHVNTSLSVWVKRSALNFHDEIVTTSGRGPTVVQDFQKFMGQVHTSMYTPYVKSTDFNDLTWHHIVVTYDGTLLKLYVDGSLEGTSNSPQPYIDDLVYYRIGFTSEYPDSFWEGAVDDLRFYSRTLSASDVQKLYNL